MPPTPAPHVSYNAQGGAERRRYAVTWHDGARCPVCWRYTGHFADGWGDHLAYCPKCAVRLDGQRHLRHRGARQPRPTPPPPATRKATRGRSWLR